MIPWSRCITSEEMERSILWHTPMPQEEDCKKSHTPVFMDLFLLAIKLQKIKKNGLKIGS